MDFYIQGLQSYLISQPNIVNVNVTAAATGCTPADIAAFSGREGFKLPDDLAAFLVSCNGFRLTFDVRLRGEAIPCGSINLYTLAQIRRVDASEAPKTCDAAFALGDADPDTCGTVALVYTKGSLNIPSVMLKRKGLDKWHFIAASWADYFRLSIMHFGLPRWQLAFTEHGLDLVVQQWLRWLGPEKLAASLTKTNDALKRLGS